MSIRHPVVAISYAHDSPAAPEWFSRELDRLATPVVDALRARGVQVRVLDAVRDTEPEAAASGADAVIVLGGADIDPTLYRHTPHSTVQGTHRSADEFETRLIRAAVNLDRPVLGICRGAQLVNVALGGTLVQHLGDDTAHRRARRRRRGRSDRVACRCPLDPRRAVASRSTTIDARRPCRTARCAGGARRGIAGAHRTVPGVPRDGRSMRRGRN